MTEDLKKEANRLHADLYHNRQRAGDIRRYGMILYELTLRGVRWDYSPTDAALVWKDAPEPPDAS